MLDPIVYKKYVADLVDTLI